MEKYKAHILVVDDDDGIRELVKQFLNKNNYLVTTAKNAEDALEKVKIIKFDLIVTKKYRGKGIGSALLDKVVTHASDINAKRICWEVLTWNISAIEFYKSKGADVKQDWNVVHLNEDGIKNYISKLKT